MSASFNFISKQLEKEVQNNMNMTVGVVGLGLIGASFAKAYKSDDEATVYGWNRTKSITQMALMQGIIWIQAD